MLKTLNRELASLNPEDLDAASSMLGEYKGTLIRQTASMPDVSFEQSIRVWYDVIGILTEVIRFARIELVRRKGGQDRIQVPKAYNIVKWIRIIIFFIQVVKRVVKAVKREKA